MSPTYDYTNKQASFHSRQGRIWRLGLKFLLVHFRIGMASENNSSSVCIAQLSSVNNEVHFARFYKFSELPPEANMWAHSRCRSTALALSEENSPISSWFHSNIHPRPTIFIAKAAITSNDVGSVSRVNLLMNAASPSTECSKITMAAQEPHCACWEIKLIPRLMGSPRQQAPVDLSRNES